MVLYQSYEKKDEVKESLIKEFNLNRDKKIVILALPQWFENKVLNRETTDKYHKLLVDNIIKNDVNLLISLHPKMGIDYYKNKLGNVNVLNQSLSSCLPVADIFVSGFRA